MPNAVLLDTLARGELSGELNRAITTGLLRREVITVRQTVVPEIYRRKRYVRQQPREVLTRGINVALLSDVIAVGFAHSGLFARNTDDTWRPVNTDQLRQLCTAEEIGELLATASAALTRAKTPPTP